MNTHSVRGQGGVSDASAEVDVMHDAANEARSERSAVGFRESTNLLYVEFINGDAAKWESRG
jgi:hypothetical protein